MPYIISPKRKPIDDAVAAVPFMEHGDLTYAITRLMVRYVLDHGGGQVLRYTVLSQALSAAQDAADEFYRRVVVPFEDRKRAENGDAYDPIETS